MIHRDIKPENILVFNGDHVVVSDFGLGKRIDPNSPDWGLTVTGESLGTLEYVAPEQLRSFADEDPRSDVYSLGKVLYYCLTGKVPYPEIDLDLVDVRHGLIIQQCTEEDINKRCQSVDELTLILAGAP